jgi:hypothetical protein
VQLWAPGTPLPPLLSQIAANASDEVHRQQQQRQQQQQQQALFWRRQ